MLIKIYNYTNIQITIPEKIIKSYINKYNTKKLVIKLFQISIYDNYINNNLKYIAKYRINKANESFISFKEIIKELFLELKLRIKYKHPDYIIESSVSGDTTRLLSAWEV